MVKDDSLYLWVWKQSALFLAGWWFLHRRPLVLTRHWRRLPKPATLWLLGAMSTRSIANTICIKAAIATCAEQFGLSANLAVRAIARVAPRLANPKTRHSQFKPTSIDYDSRIFKLDVQNEFVSLRLLDGRCILALRLGEFQRQGLQGQQPSSATLKKGRKNRYYLDVQVKEDAPQLPSDADIDATLGVDVGLRQIATDSAGHAFQGQDLADYREHRADVRASLQAKADTGSKSTRKACRRALKRLSGRERRHQKRVNHEISKQLVTFAKEHGLAIVFECLKGIRDRCKFRRGQRRRLHSWAFYQLQQFVEYKARRAGVRVVCIDPTLHISNLCGLSACWCSSSRRFLLQRLWAAFPRRL